MAKVEEKDLNELFSELKNENNEIVFQKLYTQYNKLVYGIAFSIVKNKEDAEDIVQIFFSKLYAIEKEKLPKEKISSWIYTVTKNEAISLLRKKRNDFDLETIYEIEDKDDEINKVLDKEEFNKLISKLNDKEKEIISLKILANLSFEEIAKLLNKPSGTVKWVYYKGVHTLKLLLSNLAMFVLSFTIGLTTLFNKKSEVKQELLTNNEIEDKEENTRLEDTNETTKSQLSESVINDTKDEIDETHENTVVEQIQENNLNYVGIGILSFSAIFLCLTIIFTIFFTKYQLKSRKKSSK